MKSLAKYLSVLLVAGAGVVAGQAAEFKTLPGKFDGSMMPYDFSRCDSTVAWNDSLTPVFLSYTARHGARYLSSPKKIAKIQKALYEAALKRKLTPQGERFYGMLKEISKNTDGRWGLLSEVGISEEVRLGADMGKMLPDLFRNGKSESIATSVPRVIMTMDQFLHSLEIKNQDLELYTASGKQNNSLLCCFIADSLYDAYRNDGEWVPIYEKFLEEHVSDAPARRLLAAGYDNNKQRLRHLTMDMYGLMQACRASGVTPPTTEWMTEDEYRGCWQASNLLHYLRNNVSPVSDLAAKATAPLIRRIISDIDSATEECHRNCCNHEGSGDCKMSKHGECSKSQDIRMHGYFGHAETLLPLFSALRLPGCYVMTEDYSSLQDYWQIQDITPLAANMAIIILKGKSGERYASVRLNGRNISPIPGKGCVVKWSELKEYWLKIND